MTVGTGVRRLAVRDGGRIVRDRWGWSETARAEKCRGLPCERSSGGASNATVLVLAGLRGRRDARGRATFILSRLVRQPGGRGSSRP